MLTVEKAKEIVLRVLSGKGASDSFCDALKVLVGLYEDYDVLFPIDELSEDDGPVLLWVYPIKEIPGVGWLNDSDFEENKEFYGYTHFSKLPFPKLRTP